MILRVLGIMALGMSLAVSAHAGRGIDRARGQAIWDAAVNGRTTTIGTGNGSMMVIRPTTQGAPTALAGGGATVKDVIPVPVAGVAVPAEVVTNVGKEAIVGGLVGAVTGGVLGAALGVSMPLASAYLNQAGARVGSDGKVELNSSALPGYCGVAQQCFQWQYRTNGVTPSAWFNNPNNACVEASAMINPWLGAGRLTGQMYAKEQGPAGAGLAFSCFGTLDGRPDTLVIDLQRGDTRAPDSPTWYAPTPQQLKDALYKNDPPPAIIDELSKFGNIIWPGPASVTGPSSVTGPKEIKNSTSGNQSSQTVTQTSTPLTYQGSSVTAGNPTTSSTTTTTTTNADGSTSTSTSSTTTTTEEGSAPEAPAEEVAPSDTALPPVPDLYTRKYPNGMEGVWNDYKEQLKGTDLVSLVGKLMPNVGDGGSCPTWPINLDLEQWASYGTHDVAPPCWIWDVAKAILILSALLLARALVFGG